MPRLPILLAAVAALAVATAAAPAATPESGAVSKASPKVAWTGETDLGYAAYAVMFYAPDDAPCQAPRCDRFTLDVTDEGGALEIVAQNGGTTIPVVRITAPDGTVNFSQGEASKPHKVKIGKAAKGQYLIDVTNNGAGAETYKASATLTFADAVPAEASPVPTPPTTSGNDQQAQPTPPPATTATIKAPAASAKKLKKAKKIAFKATASAPLSNVAVKVLKGKKTVGAGRLRRLENAGTITVRVAKGLKAGRYRVLLAGTDGAGRTVSTATTLTVKR